MSCPDSVSECKCSGLSMFLQLHVFRTNERSKSVMRCLCVACNPLEVSEARALLIISLSALRHCRPDVNRVTAVLDTVYIINLPHVTIQTKPVKRNTFVVRKLNLLIFCLYKMEHLDIICWYIYVIYL